MSTILQFKKFFCLIFFKWSIFTVFIESVSILLLSLFFNVLVFSLWRMWDLSFLARDQTCTPCIGQRSLNHWTAREIPKKFFIFIFYLFFKKFYHIVLVLPYINMNPPRVYTCSPSWTPFPPPSPPHPSGSSLAPALSTLSHASNLDWWSVSHMILYTFQCYSLRSSQPRLLPQSPKDCYIHLCLFCCLAYRVIVTIFLNSIYMC